MIDKIKLETYKKAYEMLNDRAEYEISNNQPYIIYQYVLHFFNTHEISVNNDREFLNYFKIKINKKSYKAKEVENTSKPCPGYDFNYGELCGAIKSLIMLYEHDRQHENIKIQLIQKLNEQRNYKRVKVTDLSHLANSPTKDKNIKAKYYMSDKRFNDE